MATEIHPLQPFLPFGCKVLFLGSFPPPKRRWSMDFYYPNFINDHWRILGLVFFNDKLHFVDESNKCFRHDLIKEFISKVGIGYYDTATVVRRLSDNASDDKLEVIEATNVVSLIKPLSSLRAIVATGTKAATTLCHALGDVSMPSVGSSVSVSVDGRDLIIYRLPSSSRAYPLNINKKAEAYKSMFASLMMV